SAPPRSAPRFATCRSSSAASTSSTSRAAPTATSPMPSASSRSRWGRGWRGPASASGSPSSPARLTTSARSPWRPPMNDDLRPSCERLDAYFDGELETAAADAFRDHLAGCHRCAGELHDLLQLEGLLLESAPARPRHRAARRAAIVTVVLAAAAALAMWLLRPAPPPILALG